MSISNFSVKSELLYANGTMNYNKYSKEVIVKERLPGRTCYEYPAAPQIIIDPTKISFTMENMNTIMEVLKCPVCLKLIENPVQINSCSHCFCKACFDKSFRTGNKFCPLCRDKLVTKRIANKNNDLKRIIDLLFPDRERIIKEEEEDFEKNKEQYTFDSMKIKQEIQDDSSYIREVSKDTRDNYKEKKDVVKERYLGRKLMNEEEFDEIQKKPRNIMKIDKQITKTDIDVLKSQFKIDDWVFLYLNSERIENKFTKCLLIPANTQLGKIKLIICEKYNNEFIPEELELYIEGKESVSLYI